MAPFIPNPKNIRAFADAAAFEAWLAKNHDRATEVWLKVHKKGSGLPSVTTAEALDVALCWGWIDAIRKGLDERSFLQRYVPRKPRSSWSQINRKHVARLRAAGRMTPHGERQVALAKADGRWAAAYAPQSKTSHDSLPADLRAAIAADARAKRTFEALNRQNLFALLHRTNAMKTPAGRARKIATLVAMLARGETPWPQTKKTSGLTPAAKSAP
jgi:uncharacterized protein YdeI (YjbR/CyaY-like superfamily)